MKKSLFLVTVSLAVPFLFSCSNEDAIVALESISLDKSSVTLKVGEETTLKVTKNPANATAGFLWETSNHDSVTVTAGKLHAYSVPKDGQDVVITVMNKEKTISASCSVHVDPKDPPAPATTDGVTISVNRLDMVLGEDDANLIATVTPLDAGNRDITWTISEGGVVSKVSETQPDANASTLVAQKSSVLTLHAQSAGYATVTATDESGEFSAQAIVVVSMPAEIHYVDAINFVNDDATIIVGGTTQNPISYHPSNAIDKGVTYSSNNEAVATVNPTTGVVEGQSIGDALITATLVANNAITDSYEVHVVADSQILNVYHDSILNTVDLQLKDGAGTEYVIYNYLLSKNDEFIGFIHGVNYGFDVLKDGGVSSNFEIGSHTNYLKAKETILCDIYIETGEPDGSGNRIYIDTHTMMSLASGASDWAYNPISLKPSSDSEYLVENIALTKGSKFVFNIRQTYFHFSDLKSDSPVKDYFEGDVDNNFVVKFSGTYTIYVETVTADGNGDFIYIDGAPSGNAQILRNGAGDPETPIALSLKPGFHNEFLIHSITLAVGDKIKFFMDDTYFALKSGGYSDKFAYDNGTKYLTCNTAGTYDFYVKFLGDDLGIYVTGPVQNVTYTVENIPSWWTDASAHIYAWAFEDGIANSGHWYEGAANGSNMEFLIPSNYNKAIFVRVSGAIADLSVWNASTLDGMEKWNRADDVALSGATSTISFDLGAWHD
ncbi:MAG: Ig-like domain-containing protein [Bacilli bacterium]|nr:Ig-like domain-containing protein [Bacilli bacterium]